MMHKNIQWKENREEEYWRPPKDTCSKPGGGGWERERELTFQPMSYKADRLNLGSNVAHSLVDHYLC
jgi:hypothetical protein